MGLGMGLVMSPMTTAAMNAVDIRQAGGASGILSMNRMVGGTFGVALLGAVVTALGRNRLEDLLPHASSAQIDRWPTAWARAPRARQRPRWPAPRTDAFVHALSGGMRLAPRSCRVLGRVRRARPPSAAARRSRPTRRQPEPIAA